jgi:transposase
MRKIREVLRLKYEQRLSNRMTAKSCNVGRRTVAEYWQRAQKACINWAQDKELNDTDLLNKLCPQQIINDNVGIDRREPDWAYIHAELKRPHVTLELLWQEYREAQPNGYQRSWFGDLYRRWRMKLNVCMRQEHRAGEKIFVDYCDGIGIIDRSTGEEIPTHMFVSVWGASNYTYAEASLTQGQRDWLMSHVRAFEYYGCVPRAVVIDNLKSGVTRPCRYEPEVNASYRDLADHYGCCVLPARVRHPKDKAKVEAGVLIAQRWILACLRNQRFYSIAELNGAIRLLLEKLNSRQMQKLRSTRKELFERLDKPAGQPLPEKRYEYAAWKKARVNIDYHVEIDKHYYSVPYQLAQEQVDVRATDHTIEIFYKEERQTSHARGFDKYKHSTKPEHMPEAHRRYMTWNPERIIAWAEKTGPSAREVVKNNLESRRFPEQAYRTCLGILRLSSHYPAERVENACKRALQYRVYSFTRIKAILDTGMDKQVDLFENAAPVRVSSMHENVRGGQYYADSEQDVNGHEKCTRLA